MSIALKELLRQPRRFSAVTMAMTLLIVLLVVLGGFLDGLELSQTGAYRAHEGNVLVFDDEAELQLQRSRVATADAEALAALPAIDAVGSLDATFTVAGIGAGSDGSGGSGLADPVLEDIALFGYELATVGLPEPPAAGEAIVDEQLKRVAGIEVGDVLEIGPTAEPITVSAIVDDLTTGAPTVWVGVDEWRRLVALGNPAAVPPDGTAQILVVDPASSPEEAIAAITASPLGDASAAGPGLDPVTATGAIDALDVVQQQSSTFQGIISVTFIIVLLVVALFFALITLERVGLYAVFKALGARTGELLLGLSAQAVAISLVAIAIGFTLSALFVSLLPPELPLRVEPVRLGQIAVGTVITALLGSLFTARRILRIDPAEAIG
ncbi:MAG: ABC transporter permease [Actinomycetota bacterium]